MNIRTEPLEFTSFNSLCDAIDELTGVEWQREMEDHMSGRLQLGNELAIVYVMRDCRGDGNRWYTTSVIGLSESGKLAIANLTGKFGTGLPHAVCS